MKSLLYWLGDAVLHTCDWAANGGINTAFEPYYPRFVLARRSAQ